MATTVHTDSRVDILLTLDKRSDFVEEQMPLLKDDFQSFWRCVDKVVVAWTVRLLRELVCSIDQACAVSLCASTPPSSLYNENSVLWNQHH